MPCRLSGQCIVKSFLRLDFFFFLKIFNRIKIYLKLEILFFNHQIYFLFYSE